MTTSEKVISHDELTRIEHNIMIRKVMSNDDVKRKIMIVDVMINGISEILDYLDDDKDAYKDTQQDIAVAVVAMERLRLGTIKLVPAFIFPDPAPELPTTPEGCLAYLNMLLAERTTERETRDKVIVVSFENYPGTDANRACHDIFKQYNETMLSYDELPFKNQASGVAYPTAPDKAEAIMEALTKAGFRWELHDHDDD